MSKFIKIKIDKKNQEFTNIKYLPEVIALYERFARYLHDDYFTINNPSAVDAVIALVERTTPYFWVIIDEKTSKLAGFVFLDNWVGTREDFHSAEVTTCFNPVFWGNYTKFCAKKFIRYCFKKYKLKKIKAHVFPQNFKVKMLLKRAGFSKEAVLRAETVKNGLMQDIEVFSIIRKKEGKNEV